MKRRGFIQGLIGAVALLPFVSIAKSKDKVFIGAINSDWHNPLNWSPCGVPTKDTDIILKKHCDAFEDCECKNISFEKRGFLEVHKNITLTLYGSIENRESTGRTYIISKHGARASFPWMKKE